MSDFDVEKLTRWLEKNIVGFSGPIEVVKFSGGQSNPTYWIGGASEAYVLRRKPFGRLLPSAHAVDREYRLLTALHPTGFPVPQPYALCEDDDVIGAMFYVMELVEGRTFWDGALPELASDERRTAYDAMIETLAALHSVDIAAVGLSEYGRSGNYFARQVDRWSKQYRASQTDDLPEMDALIDWLPRSVPDQTCTAVIHGDYRLDNLIYLSTQPRVAAVLDWELSTLGDPLADLAYLLINWELSYVPGRSGLGGLDLSAFGIPSLENAKERYCQAIGRQSLPQLDWYFAYSLFRLVAIGQGVRKRIADGNASDENAAAQVERIPSFLELAWHFARRAGARRLT